MTAPPRCTLCSFVHNFNSARSKIRMFTNRLVRRCVCVCFAAATATERIPISVQVIVSSRAFIEDFLNCDTVRSSLSYRYWCLLDGTQCFFHAMVGVDDGRLLGCLDTLSTPLVPSGVALDSCCHASWNITPRNEFFRGLHLHDLLNNSLGDMRCVLQCFRSVRRG